MLKTYLLIVCKLLIVLKTFGTLPTINLNTKTQDKFFIHQGSYAFYEDTSGVKELSNINLDDFELLTNTVKKVNNTKSAYWLAFKINPHPQQNWFLEVISPHTEYLSVYLPQHNGNYQLIQSGNKRTFTQRPILHKNFVIPLHNLDPNTAILIKIQSDNQVGLLVELKTQEAFIQYSLNEYWLLGIFYGVLLLLILYNIIILVALKQRVYLWYSLMVLFAALSALSDDGLGFQYFWQNYPHWNQNLGLYIIPLGFVIFYSLYAYDFLSFTNKKKYILYALVFSLLGWGIHLVTAKQKIYFSYFYLLLLFLHIVYMATTFLN